MTSRILVIAASLACFLTATLDAVPQRLPAPTKATKETLEPSVEIAKITQEATLEWSSTRKCAVLRDATPLISEKMVQNKQAFSLRRNKYNLDDEQEGQAIKLVVQAYLDEVSTAAGPRGENCAVDAKMIRESKLPAAAGNPDTGTLDVDGSQRDADIFIDGEKKGNIR